MEVLLGDVALIRLERVARAFIQPIAKELAPAFVREGDRVREIPGEGCARMQRVGEAEL